MTTRTSVPGKLFMALVHEQAGLIRQIEWGFKEIHRLVGKAHEEHTAGNLPEARILLNEALDIEHDVTGDCAILGPLAEEWEVDYERDQRKPKP